MPQHTQLYLAQMQNIVQLQQRPLSRWRKRVASETQEAAQRGSQMAAEGQV